jgi:hypothetical protein
MLDKVPSAREDLQAVRFELDIQLTGERRVDPAHREVQG